MESLNIKIYFKCNESLTINTNGFEVGIHLNIS